MRRGLSLLMILLFGLGPLAAALPGSDESRLPPCCRRHGAHHCAMKMRMAAQAASGKPVFTAPITCPLFPGFAVLPTASMDALAAAPSSLPALLAQSHALAANRTAARMSQVRTRTGRGPPAFLLN